MGKKRKVFRKKTLFSNNAQKNNDTSINSKRRFKNQIRDKNPSIFSFELNDSFIYEPSLSYTFCDKLKDKNKIKYDENELSFLDNYIISFTASQSPNIIKVLPFFKELMDNCIPLKRNLSERAKTVDKIIKDLKDPCQISLKKITSEYQKYCEKNKVKIINKTSIFNILKNELNYRYRKTTLKTNKLLTNQYIEHSFYFLKIFIRAIKLGLKPIFLDESGFYTKNENFYTWRKENQSIYQEINDTKKVNLLMAVTAEKLIKYHLIEKSTNSDNFLNFMNDLVDSLTDEEKESSILIMDNCRSHLSPKLFEFYSNNKLKILFNIPYQSTFNMIEGCFRFIKNLTYKRLYNNISQLTNDIIKIIEGVEFKTCLRKLYHETLVVYKNYITSNFDINFNK